MSDWERTGICRPGLPRIVNILRWGEMVRWGTDKSGGWALQKYQSSGLNYYHHCLEQEIQGADTEEKQITLICGDIEWVVTVTTLNPPNPDHQQDKVSSEKSRALSVCLIIHSSGRALGLLSEWQISKKIWIVQVISVLGIEISVLGSDFYLHVVHFQHWPASD